MNSAELCRRTKLFALDAVCFCARIPHNRDIGHLRQQLQRSSMSVAANYRAACRGRSKAEFVAKLGIVEEEADESVFWLEIIEELNIRLGLKFDAQQSRELARLHDEARQIFAIMVSSRKTARGSD